ncbi:MAG: hypothetical protein Ct9H300mP23_10990 [Nitrospinota bacterium]|nr:MAG: hypothetical protein Ct9H300mP23_10990 [Nitrospinota bacterium]
MEGYAFLKFDTYFINYTGITLREPFQLLFINLALYAALKIYFLRSKGHWLVLFSPLWAGAQCMVPFSCPVFL